MTPEVRTQIVEGIRAGIFLGAACRGAGIDPSCFYRWRRKARDGHPEAIEYLEFFHTLKSEEARAEIAALAAVRSATGDPWQAAAWFLERRFPQRWGRRNRGA